MATLRVLVMDGNTRETDAAHIALGGSPTGAHYAQVLQSLRTDVACSVLHPARPGGIQLPVGVGLDAYDGIAWTGSSLNIYKDGPAVRPQVELSRAAFAAGVPQFGSCWGLQVATVAAGGKVRPNPRGRELGIARRIVPMGAGIDHPMFEGKRSPFDAIAVHMDEVAVLPVKSTRLAGNDMSAVQAAEIQFGAGVCWGVQYHPEYDLNEIATVILRHGPRLMEDGFFSDVAALNRFVLDLRTLHADPRRKDLVWLYGIDDDVLQPERRRAELRHWLDRQVAPHAAARGRG